MKIEDINKFKTILQSFTRFCERLDLNVSEIYQVNIWHYLITLIKFIEIK